MRWTYLCVLAAVMSGFVAAPPARAQGIKEALQALPDDTLAFVAVNRLNQIDDKAANLAKKLKVNAPFPIKPLAMIRLFGGIDKGLDEQGTIVAAAVPVPGGGLEPAPLVFVPVTDYKDFLGQLNPKNPDAEVTEITVVGQDLVMGKRGKFAVATMPKHQEILKKALASRTGMPVTEALQSYVEENDVAAVVTTAGVKLGTSVAQKGLEQARGFLDNLPPEAQFVGRFVDGVATFLKAVETDVTHAGIGVHLDKSGAAVHADARALFVKGSGLAKLGQGSARPPAEGLLAGLPTGPFALAAGGAMGEKANECLLNFSVEVIKAVARDLPAEKLKKLEDAYAGMIKGTRGMGLVIQVGKGDEALLGSVGGVYHVDNAETYLVNYEKSLHEMTELFKNLPVPFMPGQESKKIKVDGKPGLEVTMDYSGLPVPDEQKKIFERAFGEGAKMSISMAVLDEKTLVVRYAPAARLKETMQALKAGGGGLAKDTQIAKTTALLPEGSQWAIYISPKGVVDLANRALKMFEAGHELPEFPSTPPVGIGIKLSEGGLQIHAAVPIAVLEAAGQYVPKVRNLRLQ